MTRDAFNFQFRFTEQTRRRWRAAVDAGGPSPVRGIGYRLKEDGPMIPLLDGKTGEPVAFSKEDFYAAGFGARNEAAAVLDAMEKFDEIRLVGP